MAMRNFIPCRQNLFPIFDMRYDSVMHEYAKGLPIPVVLSHIGAVSAMTYTTLIWMPCIVIMTPRRVLLLLLLLLWNLLRWCIGC